MMEIKKKFMQWSNNEAQRPLMPLFHTFLVLFCAITIYKYHM